MVGALLLSAVTAFSGIDIYGAHTTHTLGGCTGDYAHTCTFVVPEWKPNGEGRGEQLPFAATGRITHIKLPVSGPSKISIRVVHATSKSTFRVRQASPWLRNGGKHWLTAALNLRYRAGDTLAIAVSGTEGPCVIEDEAESPEPNGSGNVLLAKGVNADVIRKAYELPGTTEDLGAEGVSMIVRTAG